MPQVPLGVDSAFDYKRNCIKQDAFISKAGVVGSHVGLDYSQTWDGGLSKGKVVCFFRSPSQRLISAYWHAQHADGMPRSEWGLMRERISSIERDMSHWREKKADMPLSVFQRSTPREMLPLYRAAMKIYFEWEGIQGCMTKMLVGYRCADMVKVTPQMEAKAAARLRGDFAFVGLTEEWDASICLFHQMLGRPAREIEFLNYRAGKMTRTKVGEAQANGTAGGAPSATSKTYDVAVLSGMVDASDERTYAVAKKVFRANVLKFSRCPAQQTARYSVEHILQGRFADMREA